MNYSVPCGIRDRRLLPNSVNNRVVGGSNSSPGNNHIPNDIILYSVLEY